MTRSTLRNAALTCATQWQWPVLPGVAPAHPDASKEADGKPPAGAIPGATGPAVKPACSCPNPDCVVPGAHPFDPVLLAATTDARMVRWWWTERPAAPLILATGGRAPCALSLPAVAGARALAEFDRRGIRVGPVAATSTRFALLVAPYVLEELGELLYAHDWVPSSLRFHGEGGYIALPPSRTGTGGVRWERRPVAERGAGGAPWLPRMETILGALVEASTTTPDTGSTLAY